MKRICAIATLVMVIALASFGIRVWAQGSTTTFNGIPAGSSLPASCSPQSLSPNPFFYLTGAGSTPPGLYAASGNPCFWNLAGGGTLSSIHSTGLTAAVSTATLCSAGSVNCSQPGNYTIDWAFTGSGTACSSVTAGSVTFLLTWTDQFGTAHSAVALQMMGQTGAATSAMGGTFPFQTALANEGAGGTFNISSNGSVIQYATGYTGCTTGTGTYQLDAWVTRGQ